MNKEIVPYVELLTKKDIELLQHMAAFSMDYIQLFEEHLDIAIDDSELELLYAKLLLDHDFIAKKL